MAKYIVEVKDGETLYKAVIAPDGEPYITPAMGNVYTEPDLEQVREEAYEDGYKTAKVQCNIQAEKDLREVGERHYQKGLSNAWEAARKVVALSTVDRRKVFGSEYMYSILEKHTAAEAIEKIRQYEQEKEEIQVGDEVDDGVANLIVLEINEDGTVKGFDDSGSIMHATPCKKTGRHFPEIAEVLQKMRKSQ